MSSIFTKIIEGEIPCYKVAEDENFIAFLDIQPLVKGHTLVVPKKEVDYIFDHDDQILSEIMVFSKKVARAMDQVFDCERIGVTVIGLEVPHTHIHLIPINSVNDMNFSKKRPNFTKDQMQTIAAEIVAKIQ